MSIDYNQYTVVKLKSLLTAADVPFTYKQCRKADLVELCESHLSADGTPPAKAEDAAPSNERRSKSLKPRRSFSTDREPSVRRRRQSTADDEEPAKASTEQKEVVKVQTTARDAGGSLSPGAKVKKSDSPKEEPKGSESPKESSPAKFGEISPPRTKRTSLLQSDALKDSSGKEVLWPISPGPVEPASALSPDEGGKGEVEEAEKQEPGWNIAAWLVGGWTFIVVILVAYFASSPTKDSVIFCDPASPIPGCRPCPTNGVCENGDLVCSTRFRREGNLCVKDEKATLRALKLLKSLREELEWRAGDDLCGTRTDSSMSPAAIKDFLIHHSPRLSDAQTIAILVEDILPDKGGDLGVSSDCESPDVCKYKAAVARKRVSCRARESAKQLAPAVLLIAVVSLLVYLCYRKRQRDDLLRKAVLQIIEKATHQNEDGLASGPTIPRVFADLQSEFPQWKSYISETVAGSICEELVMSNPSIQKSQFIWDVNPCYWSNKTLKAANRSPRAARRSSRPSVGGASRCGSEVGSDSEGQTQQQTSRWKAW